MYKYLLLLTFLIISPLHALYHFTITEKNHSIDTYFEIASSDSYPSLIKKTSSFFRTAYELYSNEGWQALAITRAVSFGSLFIWAKELDIYEKDLEGNMVTCGMIEGWLFPGGEAKFELFDPEGNVIGTAWLDNSCSSFTLYKEGSDTHILATLSRQFLQAQKDSWQAIIYEPESVHPKIFRLFAAFVLDTQLSFRRT